MRCGLAIRTVHRSHSTSGTVLSVASHPLTLPHLAGAKAFDGNGFPGSIEISSDGVEVAEGFVQAVRLFGTYTV